MEYFYLVYGNMGLRILSKLIESGNAPGLIISHKTYNFEKSETDFYEPLQKLAEANKIEIKLTDRIEEEAEIIKRYKAGICSGFMEILRENIFGIPEYGIFNLHCGKLPNYRGRAPISRSIINGEKELTVSLHKIDSGVDSGDILLTGKIEITEQDDVNSLYEKCIPESQKVIEEALKIIEDSKDKIEFEKHLRPQEKTELKANRMITDEERRIKLNSDILQIYNLSRALYPPYPGAFFMYKNKEYRIEKTEYEKNETLTDGGKIIFVSEEELAIEFKGGRLRIRKLSTENNPINNFREIFTEGEHID